MDQNPYATPTSEVGSDTTHITYAGFWLRVIASLIDSLLIMLITYPILFGMYGSDYFLGEKVVAGIGDFLLTWVFPATAIILFWVYRSATPGKMLIKAKIVDAKTGAKPSTGKLIGRYFAYFVSMIPLMLGIIWVGIDKRKQGWHDKIAGTVVIRETKNTDGKAVFES